MNKLSYIKHILCYDGFGDNIALNRPVSHTPATYAGDKYKATLAADGDFDTTFRLLPPYTCSLTNRNNETSPTWTVTLDNLYQITGIVIFNRRNARHRRRLANFTVFGTCDGLEKIVLYDDAQHNRHQLEVIKLEINDTHLCSSISIQIPQEAVSGHVQYLSLCGVQIYAAVCSKPTSPFFTEISPNKKWYIKDESFNFQCKIGYRPSPSNTIVSCCGVDTFCPSSPICKRVYCQLPSQPNNGKYNTSTSTNTSLEYGSVIYGECNIGYKEGISGTTRRCQQNGTWSGQDLVCTQIICNPPPGLQNGYYTYTNNSEYNNTREPYNTNLTGHCNVGYKHSTPSTVSCGLDESWTGEARRSNKGFKLTETAERSNIATIGCVARETEKCRGMFTEETENVN
ncbi:Membrane cofactor protein [Mactra antiquata]